MNAKNNNNKKTQTKTNKKYINPFSMDIKDDIYDPFNHDDIFGTDFFENRMFRTFRNIFTDFGLPLEEAKEEPKEEKKEEKNQKKKKSTQNQNQWKKKRRKK